MNLRKFPLEPHRLLESEAIPHALIGGYAMAVPGYRRATKVVDYPVDGDFQQSTKPLFGQAGFSLFHQSREVLQMQREHPLDILFANRPLSREH